jgi:hypothetical protein
MGVGGFCQLRRVEEDSGGKQRSDARSSRCASRCIPHAPRLRRHCGWHAVKTTYAASVCSCDACPHRHAREELATRRMFRGWPR